MGLTSTISIYNQLYGTVPRIKQPIVTKSPEEAIPGLPLVEDARDITLAQYEPMTKNHITAHRIKDYRRKTFNLVLLPEVNILFDKFLEGCTYYEKQLLSTSPYS